MDLTTTTPLSLKTLCQQGLARPWTLGSLPVRSANHTVSEDLQNDSSTTKEPNGSAKPDNTEKPLFSEPSKAFLSAENTSAPSAGYRLTPNSAAEVAQLLHWASESQQPLTLRADEAALLKTPFWLDLARLKQVRHYNADDFVIQVENGLTFGELDTLLSAQGQAFPLSYPHEARLIDLLAEERQALETGLRGFLRDYVLKTEIATPDGQVTISGADVVKSVTGYDLHKFYIGSQNAFGVITAVTLKLTARPEMRQAWRVAFPDFSSAQAFTTTLLQRSFPWNACEIFHTNGDWFVWLEIAGHSSLIPEGEALLSTFTAPFERIDPNNTSAAVPSPLRQWPTGARVIEAALPLSHWPAFCQQALLDKEMAHWRYQIRPAAGLVYFIEPSETCDFLQPSFQGILQQLHKLAESMQGFVQIVQIQINPLRSDGTQNTGPYRTDAPSLLQALAEVNIPRDETVRDLLKTLKQSYDPNGCLLTPYLPL